MGREGPFATEAKRLDFFWRRDAHFHRHLPRESAHKPKNFCLFASWGENEKFEFCRNVQRRWTFWDVRKNRLLLSGSFEKISLNSYRNLVSYAMTLTPFKCSSLRLSSAIFVFPQKPCLGREGPLEMGREGPWALSPRGSLFSSSWLLYQYFWGPYSFGVLNYMYIPLTCILITGSWYYGAIGLGLGLWQGYIGYVDLQTAESFHVGL